MTAIILVLLVGTIIGWLGNILIEGHGLGVKGDIAFSVAGAALTTFVYTNLNHSGSGVGRLLFVSIAGALFFLAPIALLSAKAKRTSI